MPIDRALTLPEFAKRYRIGQDKARAMIRRGELRALNTAGRGQRPRYIVTPEAICEWEEGRQVMTPAPRPRRKKQTKREGWIDFFPGN